MCLCGMCMRRVPKVKVSLPIYPHVGSIPYLTLPCLTYLPDPPTYLAYHPFIHSIISDAIFETKKKKTNPLPPIENMTEERKKENLDFLKGDFFAPCSFFPTRRYLLCQPYLPYLHWVHTWLCWCFCCCWWSWSFSFWYIKVSSLK